MKRREFLKKSFLTTTFLSCGGFSIASQGNEFKPREYWPKRDDNWKYMGKKDTSTVKREKEYTFDVAVIGVEWQDCVQRFQQRDMVPKRCLCKTDRYLVEMHPARFMFL